ncbi:MAG TPA: hypothetical protein DCP92_10450 [Nitrospiraceae bacterium]|jgi:hypothetical protein|nr:hypothetical protein [Nitrospiraceae bacterium]
MHMEKKSRHPRYLTKNMGCKIMSDTKVDIIDISTGGIALMADVKLDMNTEYALKLEQGGKAFSVKGIVVWSVLGGCGRGQHGDAIPIYEAGLKFTKEAARDTSSIDDFNESRKICGDRRSIARHDIECPEKATLYYPYYYRIKKISPDGMLIQTERPYRVNDTFPIELFLADLKPFKVFGKVTSCLKTPKNDYDSFDIGIEFLEMSNNDTVMLEKFIDKSQLSKGL